MRYTVTFTTDGEFSTDPRINGSKIFDIKGAATDREIADIAQRVAGYDSEISSISDVTGRSIETPIAREVRLEEERVADEMEWASVRGISAPDF